MPNAAVYLRISQDATGEQAGVTRQSEDCLKLVETQGWTLHEVYTDNDVSAYKTRPGYQKMLNDIRGGYIDAIVAWHPDRLYRRLSDLEGLIGAIESRNVILRTCRAGELDLATPTGRMLARIVGSVAMAEGEVKADRWKRSWQQGREAGRPVRSGTRMFGYTKSCPRDCEIAHTHETRDGAIIDHEAAIARVMAAKIRQGDSILGVCRWLDKQEIRSTLGKAWRPAGLKIYLTNPRLAGWATLNGEIVAEGQWEPILDRDTFEAVRAMLTARTRAYVPRKSLLLSLIYCGACGHRMITSGQKGKRTYRCPNRPGMNGCGRVSGNAEPIEEYVEGWAAQRLDDDRVREGIARLLSHPTEALAEATSLELRVIELETQLDEPGVPVDAIVRAIGRAKERLGELDLTLATAGTITLPMKGAKWPEDLQRRRRLVDLVVERVALLPADPKRGSGNGFDTGRVQITPRQ